MNSNRNGVMERRKQGLSVEHIVKIEHFFLCSKTELMADSRNNIEMNRKTHTPLISQKRSKRLLLQTKAHTV